MKSAWARCTRHKQRLRKKFEKAKDEALRAARERIEVERKAEEEKQKKRNGGGF